MFWIAVLQNEHLVINGEPMTEPIDSSRVPKPLSGPLERQRDETVETLQGAFEQGVMNLEEYEERIALATTASTEAELDVLTLEMSTELVPANPAPLQTPSPQDTQARIRAVFGEVAHKGAWVLAPRVDARAVFGEVRLDLAQVEWVENQAEIHCKAVFGSIVIVVPEGVQVDCSGVSVLGSFTNKSQATSKTYTHRLKISGQAVFGSVEVVRG